MDALAIGKRLRVSFNELPWKLLYYRSSSPPFALSVRLAVSSAFLRCTVIFKRLESISSCKVARVVVPPNVE